jgi:hypothetical protein
VLRNAPRTRLIFDTYRNRFWIVSLTRNMGPRPSNPSPAHKTAIELFIAGVRGWEAGLRRLIV